MMLAINYTIVTFQGDQSDLRLNTVDFLKS